MILVTVKHRDGSEAKAQVWASTEIAFERKFKLAWSEAFSTEHTFQEYVYFTAWYALTEEGKCSLDFDSWVKTIETVGVEAPDENPLPQAP
ncbi:hypothetical protein UFOVP227_20 [uncultured Caudovirales phage]|jgi:hypothetical protein|uniref:Uncharacterized protein n=1 Tax=uncultured Caudovirales phage TaxID=2100421 RepID=A0A6J7WSE2_9CAUD|nr:hypothetical protein UFOVP227_20 [uncultured Caudovirales phage]